MLRGTVLVVAALVGHTPLAAACSCPRPTVEDLIEDKRDVAVFSARVVSILSPEPGRPAVTRLQIGEVIRGDVPRIIEMTGVTAADHPCGVDFRPGEVRTLAAYKKDGRWLTDLCLIPRL
jgi:hypothetical protein